MVVVIVGAGCIYANLRANIPRSEAKTVAIISPNQILSSTTLFITRLYCNQVLLLIWNKCTEIRREWVYEYVIKNYVILRTHIHRIWQHRCAGSFFRDCLILFISTLRNKVYQREINILNLSILRTYVHYKNYLK